MKKVKYRCPACKTVQWIEYSPILSRTLQCQKCEAKFNAAYSKPNGAVNNKKRAAQAPASGKNRPSAVRSGPNRGKAASTPVGVCPSCGSPKQNARIERPKRWRGKICAALLLITAILVSIGFGFVHVITGSNLPAPHIVRKSSFGYRETFINIDRVTGMPWVFARSRYPVGCRVLQETGHIESDEAFERRIKREFAQLNR